MPSFQSTLQSTTGLLAAGSAGINTARNLAGAVSTAFNSGEGGDVASAIRAINLPAAGEAVGDIISAVSTFGGDANANDWRVRLSLANWSSFKTSPVLSPLKDAGGLIFPYTPRINIHSGASYSPVSPIHSNYQFHAYRNSEPGKITINAPMYVEDSTQGLYWIAMVHYLRSLTKMFAGNDPKAGNPPPVVFLNGYGNYVFKNVPVVVTSMSVELENNCDYIGVNVVGSAAGEIQGVADSISGLASGLGGLANDFGFGADSTVGGILGGVSAIAGGVGQVAALAGTFGLGGTVSGGVSHVPTKTNFIVTLQPVYSRDSARNFSLDRFVQGGYLNNSFGYI
jgi:hypothetical protein